jgi:hypothetical protein
MTELSYNSELRGTNRHVGTTRVARYNGACTIRPTVPAGICPDPVLAEDPRGVGRYVGTRGWPGTTAHAQKDQPVGICQDPLLAKEPRWVGRHVGTTRVNRYNGECAVRPTGGNLSGSGVGRRAARGGAPRGDHDGVQVQQRMRSKSLYMNLPTGGNPVLAEESRGVGCHVGTTRMTRNNSACAIRPNGGNLSRTNVGRRAARGGAPHGDHEGGQVQQRMRSKRHAQ